MKIAADQDELTPAVQWDPEAETLTECPICKGTGEVAIEFRSGVRRTEREAMRQGGRWVLVGCEACSGDAGKIGTGRVTRSQKERLTRK